jgi:serine phosphatase RsbU (regulator of sigma subunit)
LAEKNRAIVDSIRYAKRIQGAMLPSEEEASDMFDDFFVLNKPRDIIGGDFYWMSQVDNKKVVVVADCTGHGVPGALMSMLGNTLLRDVVDKKKITEPDQVLAYLNVEIAKLLHQKDNGNNDGMDMTVVCVDDQAQTLTFSGAHHKMVYVQDGATYIVSGDRCGVGGNSQKRKNTTFVNYTIDFTDGEEQPMFYLFSDGFRDQFGGKENKKYSLSKLVKTLQQNHQEPAQKQRELLTEELITWMKEGNETQIDDVLVLGFRPKPIVLEERAVLKQQEAVQG